MPPICLNHARVAELVDALVSNTSGSNAVPVRPRPRVLETPCNCDVAGGFRE